VLQSYYLKPVSLRKTRRRKSRKYSKKTKSMKRRRRF